MPRLHVAVLALWRVPVATFRATGRYDIKSPNCRIYKAIHPEALRLEGLRLLKYAAAGS
jgi:hypothetical protein